MSYFYIYRNVNQKVVVLLSGVLIFSYVIYVRPDFDRKTGSFIEISESSNETFQSEPIISKSAESSHADDFYNQLQSVIDYKSTYSDFDKLMQYSKNHELLPMQVQVMLRAVNETRCTVHQETSKLGWMFWNNYASSMGTKWIQGQNVIVSQFRSGSSFLGELLSSYPATFFTFEPLMFTDKKIPKDEITEMQLQIMRAQLHCDYDSLGHLLADTYPNVSFRRNVRLWKYCQEISGICRNSTFLTEMCRSFPIQNIKIVRLRLKHSEQLLDPRLNVKFILLIRDPRGSLVSRKEMSWCTSSPECISPKTICKYMVDDFKAYKELREKYPNNYIAIRYEDISLSMFRATESLLDFLKLDFHASVKSFINTHSSTDKASQMRDKYGTFRNSAETAFRWRKYFKDNLQELYEVQEDCAEAMQLWGYIRYDNSTKIDLENFFPVDDPILPEMFHDTL